MGRIVNNQTLTASGLLRLPSPVLLCVSRADFGKAIEEAGYQMVRLNLPFARLLTGLPEQDILSTIAGKIRELLPRSKSVYLTDYEMLFDPRYNLDVIRLFVDLSRQNKLIVKWCGEADGDALTYAEQGCDDYKRYRIDNYDVTVVK